MKSIKTRITLLIQIGMCSLLMSCQQAPVSIPFDQSILGNYAGKRIDIQGYLCLPSRISRFANYYYLIYLAKDKATCESEYDDQFAVDRDNIIEIKIHVGDGKGDMQELGNLYTSSSLVIKDDKGKAYHGEGIAVIRGILDEWGDDYYVIEFETINP